MKTTAFSRILKTAVSLLLCAAILCALPGIFPQGAAAKQTWTVLACSDFQAPGGDAAGQQIVAGLLTQAMQDVPNADGFFCCGDYSLIYNDLATTQSGIAALQQTVAENYPSIPVDEYIFIQGNHDNAGAEGLASTGSHDRAEYGAYIINEDDYMWGTQNQAIVRKTASDLEQYLEEKLLGSYTAPIFIISHLPLHYSQRTLDNGDGEYAGYIFDVLNEAGKQGLNIVYLFGHNHNCDDYYLGGGSVFLQKGDSMMVSKNGRTDYRTETLNFTYLNAGYVGNCWSTNNTDNTLTLTAMTYENGTLTFRRYDKDGLHNLKSAGVSSPYADYAAFAAELTVYPSPETVVLNTEVAPHTVLPASAELCVGETVSIDARTNTANCRWTVENTSVAELAGTSGETARLRGVSGGNTVLTLTASNGSLHTTSKCNIRVYDTDTADRTYSLRLGADCFTSDAPFAFADYSGKVGGVSFKGVRGQSSAYQPHCRFTAAAVKKLKQTAAEQGCDVLRIHAYAVLYNNHFVLDRRVWVGKSWTTLDIPVSRISEAFDFWSQSEGSSDVYLYFELLHIPAPTEKDPCTGYRDIDRNAWYHTAADFCIRRGIMGSTSQAMLSFEPNTTCTRAMLVSVLYRLSDAKAPVYEACFKDVAKGQWYTDAVIWAYQNGIVNGYDTGLFGPNDVLTREQIAVIMKGYTEKIAKKPTDAETELTKFPDADRVTWSKSAVSWAVAEKLLSGKENLGQTLLDPQGKATRAEVASVLMRFIQNILGI